MIELKPHIQNELKLHDIIIMEIYICKEKIEKKSFKYHHYKYSIRIIHYERRDNVDIVETNYHLDTNVALKNHVNVNLKKNLTPLVETPRMK